MAPSSAKRLLAVIFYLIALQLQGTDTTKWIPHSVEAPGFKLEYKVPPYLEMAYGEEKISESLSDEGKLFKQRLGKFSSEAMLAAYWYKTRTGLFSEKTDLSVELCAIKIDDAYPAVESVQQLADFLGTFVGKKYLLKDGSEAVLDGPMTATNIRGREVILVTAADMTRDRQYELTETTLMRMSPTHSYFVRVDSRFLIKMAVTHFNEKHYTAKWYDNAMGMAESIIETLVVTKRGTP